MLSPKLQMLQRTLQRLMRRGATGPLQNVLAKSHAADLAFLLGSFTPQERQFLIEVKVGDAVSGQGLGRSKQEAAQRAAADALSKVGET